MEPQAQSTALIFNLPGEVLSSQVWESALGAILEKRRSVEGRGDVES